MVGLCLVVGAIVFAFAGVVATVGAVGVVLIIEGVFAELVGGDG